MKTGSYARATCSLVTPSEEQKLDLLEASLTVYPTGMAEIIHYMDGVKVPQNKRTICVPVTNLILFSACGYAY